MVIKDGLTYPKVWNDSNGCYIVFRLNGKRFRIRSGELVDDPTTNLNNYPENPAI
jgi:nitrite reductase/ring-hydroxylating ferredoxin subunit